MLPTRQVITCKYCGDAGHVQSECHMRATDFPALTRSKPRESGTAVPDPEPVTRQKKKDFLQSELEETDLVTTTSSIKIRKQLNNTSNHLQIDQVED